MNAEETTVGAIQTGRQPPPLRIGGWLLFLCVLLTLVLPLCWGTAYIIFVGVALNETEPELVSEVSWVLIGIAIPYVLRLGFGIIVGRALWNIKSYALRIADINFILFPAIAVVTTVVLAILRKFDPFILVWPVLEFWWSAIWLTYLHKSVRVWETFHRS
jgi:hypothetical protein